MEYYIVENLLEYFHLAVSVVEKLLSLLVRGQELVMVVPLDS